MTPRRPTTGGEQTPTGAPVAYWPVSPVTQYYRLDSPGSTAKPVRHVGQSSHPRLFLAAGFRSVSASHGLDGQLDPLPTKDMNWD